MLSFVATALAIAAIVKADPRPTSPFSTSVFDEGATCTIQWDADTTGVWNPMNIELMTGDNFHMVHLSTVASNLDGTDASNTTFSYPCLKVTPNSAIYFYRFTTPKSANQTYTTRFTLAGPNGETTPPTNATQPGTNDPIPWGTGALVDPSQGTPVPPMGGATGSNGTVSAAPVSSSQPSVALPTVSAPLSSGPVSSAPLSKSSVVSKSSSSPSGTSSAPTTSGSSAASHFSASQFVAVVPLLSLLSFL